MAVVQGKTTGKMPVLREVELDASPTRPCRQRVIDRRHGAPLHRHGHLQRGRRSHGKLATEIDRKLHAAVAQFGRKGLTT